MYAFQENNVYELPSSNLLQPIMICPVVVPGGIRYTPLGPEPFTRIIYGATSFTESLARVDLGPDTMLTGCLGNSLLLDATTPYATSYLWSDNSTNPTLTVTQSGTYWVEVMQDACSSTDTIEVIFNEITSTVNSSTVCNNGCAQLEATVNTPTPCCQYRLEIDKSPVYGTVLFYIHVDGVPVPPVYIYTSGVEAKTYYFTACDGASIDVVIDPNYAFNLIKKQQYAIYDPSGNMIFQEIFGNTLVGGHVGTASCPPQFNYNYT